jgi:hypothetical protein
MEIEMGILFESLNDRRPHGYVKTIDGKLYILITHSELIDVLKDCGISVNTHNQANTADKKLCG